ncbi:MAG: saccharopine dehydrogenase NADP-binding domain-containing protein [Acidobacteria bacterium]|jgi:saccharopine dehydrogenase (NADP+, L-glutamate forming)/spermidine synthase|nr:saccharopine dehydrogenase NADP-binding domain-containing protein [Acidobacteriota bacterium]
MKQKKILILGSGMVSRPGVRYLLDQENLEITVASNELPAAQKLVQNCKNGRALPIDVSDKSILEAMVKDHDIIVSLLPWIFHVQVAELCIKNNKPMATTSYVSEGMKKLDAEARSKGLLFLNEMGVDPGIDHMSALKVIHDVYEKGGKVLHFYSYCGGLPAPKDNDNPFGYKFSWSPRGVVLASKNSARYLENGNLIEIEGRDLFLNKRIEEIEELGTFEVYPNRDSMPYKDLYGLVDAETVMRGTYRYPGWCDTLKKIVDLGLVDETPIPDLKGKTYKQMMADITGAKEPDDVVTKVVQYLGLEKNSEIIKRFEWLGLFSDDKVPDYNNRLDILCQRMQEKLYFKEGEVDLLLMRHKFIVENNNGNKEIITSTMIDYGIPHGDSSMARTVSLPLAIGVKMMAEGKINLTGVHIPVLKEIYEPVIAELEKLNIKMVERRMPWK